MGAMRFWQDFNLNEAGSGQPYINSVTSWDSWDVD